MQVRALASFITKSLHKLGVARMQDFAPDVAGGGMFPYLDGSVGHTFGMVIGKGGADTITRALVSAIEARGGRVETGIAVTQILRQRGRLTG